MPDPRIIWAQAAQQGDLYKVIAVDDEGTYSMVFDLESSERLEYLLKCMRLLLKKYDIDRGSTLWKDLSSGHNLLRFMVSRQREAIAIQNRRKAAAQTQTDHATQPCALSVPFCQDDRILSPQHQLWKSFTLQLKGPAGIRFSLNAGNPVWHCAHTLQKTAAILEEYAKDGIDVQATLDFYQQHGCTCDCMLFFDFIGSIGIE